MEAVAARPISTNVRIRIPAAAKVIVKATQATSNRLAAALLERWFLTPRRSPLPPEEAAFLASGRFDRLATDLGELAVWSWGEGPTVLLVHGWGSRSSRWRTIAPALVEAGFRVVAFDGPGHGATGGRRSSLPETARAVRWLAEAERDRRGRLPRAVVAHSFGSAASILVQRYGVRFERNVFLAPATDFHGYLHRWSDALELSPAVLNLMVRRIEQRLGFCWDELRVSGLTGLSGRALVLHDPADGEVPYGDAKLLVNAWPNASLVPSPGLGHRRLLHDPGLVSRVVEFVAAA
ncbi:MAG TPA: alpha/beta fold hydrolase [Longimicrobiales bacterium]|nr:alpha/beta fold hydrolase [Longimicrobiales bacterium]